MKEIEKNKNSHLQEASIKGLFDQSDSIWWFLYYFYGLVKKVITSNFNIYFYLFIKSLSWQICTSLPETLALKSLIVSLQMLQFQLFDWQRAILWENLVSFKRVLCFYSPYYLMHFWICKTLIIFLLAILSLIILSSILYKSS